MTSVQRTRAALGQTVKGRETIETQVEKTDQPNYDVEQIFQQAHQSYRQKMNMFYRDCHCCRFKFKGR